MANGKSRGAFQIFAPEALPRHFPNEREINVRAVARVLLL